MVALPLFASVLPADVDIRAGRVGAAAFGIARPMPVQERIWRLHEARGSDGPLYESVAVEVPRRAGKTDALLALVVGRCSRIDGHQVIYCAQSGTKSRERFYSLLRRMRRGSPDGWRARESRGEERIEWENGSMARFAPPIPSWFRGDPADWVILDEAQEVDPDASRELVGAVLPLMDTSTSPQLTVAGTAGPSRDGLLWDALVKGRTGVWGILEYAADEGADIDDESVWLSVHPGPAGVSAGRALSVLRRRHAELDAVMWAREYLGVWPLGSGSAAFDLQLWQRLGRPLAEERPERVGLGLDVTPGGHRAAVVAAWRNTSGEAWLEVVREDVGTEWVPAFVAGVARRWRVPVGHDTAGVDTLAVVDELARLDPSLRIVGCSTVQMATACAVLDREVRAGVVRHARQPALDGAVAAASRRVIRDAGWAWGRRASSGHIHALVAATVALRMWDGLPARASLRIITAR